MSVTHQPPADDPMPDAARQALRDRTAAHPPTTRRDCLRVIATVSGGLAAGGVAVAAGALHRHADAVEPPEPKLVAERLEPGASVTFRFPGEEDRALAVRLPDGTLVGYSAVCTHLACAVLWRADRGMEGELLCPCHEGVFEVRTGEVTAGPPPRPLPRIVMDEDADGAVWAVTAIRSGESAKDAWCRQFADRAPEQAVELGCPGARTPRVTEGRV